VPPGRPGRPGPGPAADHGGGAVAGAGAVAVPMQGVVVAVLVAVGDRVEAGQAVAVLEAMKMENQMTVGHGGTVTEIRVEPGQSVGTGDVLMVIG
ncbi:MAG: biotin/lipoyl-containing protein, partial [Acidimicrobiales bacterium]